MVLIFSLSSCKKSNNTSSESDTSIQTDISSIDTSAENITNKENPKNEQSSSEESKSQSSSEEEIKPQSSSDSPSKDENSNPSTHTHSFSNATCTEPKKCICGATDGVALGHTFIQGKCSVCGTKDTNYIPLKNSIFYKTFIEKNPVDGAGVPFGHEIGYIYYLSFGKAQKGYFNIEYAEGIDFETAYNYNWFTELTGFNSMSKGDMIEKITNANVGDEWYCEYFYIGDKIYFPWAGGGPYHGEIVETNDFKTVFNDRGLGGIGTLEYVYDGNDTLEITSFVFDSDDINNGTFSVGDRYIRLTSGTKQNIFTY